MIYLYDASAIICSATLSTQKLRGTTEQRGDFNYYSFPTAGIYALLSYITTDLKRKKKDDSIVVAFDCPIKDNIRKQYYPDYKACRLKYPELGTIPDTMGLGELTNLIRNTYPTEDTEKIVRDVVKQKAIQLQKRILKWILKEIGVVVLEHPNLEADDLIYSTCSKYGKDHGIFLRADDGDLHDCACYTTNFTMQSVAGHGKITPNIGVVYKKIFHGDLKDGVYALSSRVSRDKLDGLDMSIRSGRYDASILGSYDFLLQLGFTHEESCEIVKNNFLITPKIVDVEVNPVHYDYTKLCKMYSIFGFDSLLKRIDGARYRGTDLEDIHRMVYSILPLYVKEWYHNRRYAVDKSIEVYNDKLESYETSKTINNIDKIIALLEN